MQDSYIFKRVEKKYRLSEETYNRLLENIRDRLLPDPHGVSTICSLYLDTPDFLLIRNSIEAISYKEKLRLRSYGAPSDDSRIFFEIKKKLKGVVYKRRVAMRYNEVKNYINGGAPPFDSQIMREIDYAMSFYGYPAPKVCILSEREAYYSKENPDLRLTFDTNIRYRYDFPTPESISEGTHIIGDGEHLLEIKTGGGMPLWLSCALAEDQIYPISFSKYATAYRDIISNNKISEMKGISSYV